MSRQLLSQTLIFSSFTDPFKDEIAKIMTPIEAPAGHVFIKEGEEITKFMIVESGSLVRTKASAGEGEPLVLDTIGENGVTGFMHVAARTSGIAYATVSAGEEGAKVWVVGVEFNEVLSWVRENFEPQVEAFNKSNDFAVIKMDYTADRLDINSASYAVGYDAVCLFVNDTASADVLQILSMGGVGLIAMRCAGFAKTFGMNVARVPAYSPYAVAEHAIALLMSINRKTHAANTRVKMANFTLDSGLLGMDIYGKNVGVMGTGKIGQILCGIVKGFGANLFAYDVFEADCVKEMGGKYVSQEEIYKTCDVIFLMMPLLPATKHTINKDVLPLLKKGVIIINTSRGGLIETSALLDGIQSGIIGGAGIDVYENEGDYFFQDWSAKNIDDPVLVALLGSNKVVMTAHQAFFTREAIDKIVGTTIENIQEFSEGKRGKDLTNSV
eukprot:scaffold45368_cov68-Cyclotella_meneghiniana.AAC.5